MKTTLTITTTTGTDVGTTMTNQHFSDTVTWGLGTTLIFNEIPTSDSLLEDIKTDIKKRIDYNIQLAKEFGKEDEMKDELKKLLKRCKDENIFYKILIEVVMK